MLRRINKNSTTYDQYLDTNELYIHLNNLSLSSTQVEQTIETKYDEYIIHLLRRINKNFTTYDQHLDTNE